MTVIHDVKQYVTRVCIAIRDIHGCSTAALVETITLQASGRLITQGDYVVPGFESKGRSGFR